MMRACLYVLFGFVAFILVSTLATVGQEVELDTDEDMTTFLSGSGWGLAAVGVYVISVLLYELARWRRAQRAAVAAGQQ